MKQGKVLVTGASGFLGSAIVQHLARSGVSVLATARRHSGLLAHELGMPVHVLDVMGDLSAADHLFAEAETLVHCATPNDIQSSADDGGLTLGVTGTYRLLDYAVRHGLRRVIYLSTLQVYGTELNGEVTEVTPVRCESAYGLNHYLGEEVCRTAVLRHNIDVVSLRPANVYGVPTVSTVERTTLVPMCFVKNALATGAIELRSSGLQRRNFVSTDEVAEIIGALIADFPKEYNIINAVSAWHVSIIQIVRMLQAVWRETYGEDLDLRILSAEPRNSNVFSVASAFIPPFRTRLQSEHHMSEVIKDLIKHFKSS
jgi:UDP-glucose 4-epimerase